MAPPSKIMKYKRLFGPVSSRRLGKSLGIDLVPYKYCPLNCVYCEVQNTTHLQTTREEFFAAEDIYAELDDFMKAAPELDYITFSGAGEPTLYSRIGEIIQYIKAKYPQYKLALLTNGVLFGDSEVLKEVLPCDLILPSLDAATDAVYQKINRPRAGLAVAELIQGLINLRKAYQGKMWLELFIVPGVNDNEAELSALSEVLSQIQPDLIQLNSLDRPGSEAWVEAASVEELEAAKEFLAARLTQPIEIIAKVKYGNGISSIDQELVSFIQATLSRRPSTAEDLAKMLDIHINEVMKILRELLLAHKLKAERMKRGVFYKWIS